MRTIKFASEISWPLIISVDFEMSFWYLQFSQKGTKIRLYNHGTSSRIIFIRFLGELKTRKGHFEINWPLVVTMHQKNIWVCYLCSKTHSLFSYISREVWLWPQNVCFGNYKDCFALHRESAQIKHFILESKV